MVGGAPPDREHGIACHASHLGLGHFAVRKIRGSRCRLSYGVCEAYASHALKVKKSPRKSGSGATFRRASRSWCRFALSGGRTGAHLHHARKPCARVVSTPERGCRQARSAVRQASERARTAGLPTALRMKSTDITTGISLASSHPSADRNGLCKGRGSDRRCCAGRSGGRTGRRVPWGWVSHRGGAKRSKWKKLRGRRQHHDTVGSASQLRAVPRFGPHAGLGPVERSGLAERRRRRTALHHSTLQVIEGARGSAAETAVPDLQPASRTRLPTAHPE